MNSNPYSSGCICFQDCSSWEDYTIQENDTLYNISVKFGVPIRMLMSCNKTVNPYNLQPGQIIKVPGSKPGALGCREGLEETYTIELRDTLYSISEKLETSVEELIQMNPGIDPYNLKPGTMICVPKKKAQSSNVPKPAPVPNPNPVPAPMPAPSPTHIHNLIHSSNPRTTDNNTSKPIEMSPETSDRIPTQNIPFSNNMNNMSNMNSTSSNSNPISNTTVEENFSMNSSEMNSNISNSNNMSMTSCPKDCIGKYYITQDSDTLESILDSIDLTYAALVFANPTIDFCNLYSGIRLCIPHHDMFKGCNSGTSYIIKRDDSLSSLSKRFNVPESAMLSANPFNKISDFSTPGIRICIPE